MPDATNRTVHVVSRDLALAFETHWASRTEIDFQNQEFDPGELFSTPGEDDAWVRWSLVHAVGAGGQATLGQTPVYRRVAVATVQVFYRRFRGGGDPLGHIEHALLFFETATPPLGVWFRNVGPNEVGPDGAWYQTNVLADVIYDVIRT